MAIVNKTDRKNLASTSVVGALVIWHDVRDGGEFARLDVSSLDDQIRDQLCIYGAKQITADIVAGVDGADAKVKGMAGAVDSLRAGQWPRRTSLASLEGPIAMLMKAQGIDRNAARELLGLGTE